MSELNQTAHISRSGAYTHTPLDENGNKLPEETYIFSKVDISTLTELEDYVRGEPIDMITPRLVGKPPAVQEMMINSAMAMGDKRRIGTPEFDKAVSSFTGMSYLLYLSMRVKQPHVTPATARKLFTDATQLGTVGQLSAKLMAVTGFESGKGKAGGKRKSATGEPSPSTSDASTVSSSDQVKVE